MKVLNLYAGIGGNRKYWDGEKHDITHVEIDEDVAEVLRDNFPEDEVVIGDAHQFLLENYQDYDFIWASPPCPSHSSIRKAGAKNEQYDPVYPDMKLWQEIIFLDTFFEGKWVVENVSSYYIQPVEPVRRNQHYFWSNFSIPETSIESQIHNEGNISEWEEYYGFDLSGYSFENIEKRKVLRNCVHPKIGQKILDSTNKKQQNLKEVEA